MPDFLNNFLAKKKINLFPGSSNGDGSTTPEEEDPNDKIDLNLIKPDRFSHPAFDDFKSYLSAGAPKREDYKPNLLSKILAGVAGFSELDPVKSQSTFRSIVDRPFNEATEKYNSKGERLSQLAGLESSDNSRQLNGLYKMFDYLDKEHDNKRLDADSRASRENFKSLISSRETPDSKEQRENRQLLFKLGKEDEIHDSNFDRELGLNFGDFTKREGLKHGNDIFDIKLRNNLDTARDTTKHGYDQDDIHLRNNLESERDKTKQGWEQENIRLRDELIRNNPKLTVAEYNTAYDSALQQALVNDPTLIGVTKVDTDGKPLDNDPIKQAKLRADVRARLNEVLSNTNKIRNPLNPPDNAKVVDKAKRDRAKAYLKSKTNKEPPDEDIDWLIQNHPETDWK